MNNNLDELIKERIGYTEEVKKCSDCAYSEELEEYMVDRMWYYVCNYSNLGNMRVAAHGHCMKFERKSQ